MKPPKPGMDAEWVGGWVMQGERTALSAGYQCTNGIDHGTWAEKQSKGDDGLVPGDNINWTHRAKDPSNTHSLRRWTYI